MPPMPGAIASMRGGTSWVRPFGDGRNAMAWIDHAIFWHIYPLGAAGVDVRGDHHAGQGLKELQATLDHVVELGCSGVILGPIFASHTHGYDTTDHFAIDERLGTMEDFEAFVEACHSRGIKVVLDGVFSHAGHGFTRPELLSEEVFEGHGDLRRFRHEAPEVRDYVGKVLRFWLDRGADGWRLDAAYSVPNEFWGEVLPPARAAHPEAWFLGEVIHGDYSGIVQATGMDSVTQYELWKAIWSSLKDENFFELEWSVRRHGEFVEHFTPNTFIGNHDVTRIATQVGREKALVAAAILFTLPGVPSVYYGDELGYEGLKEERFGGDDAVRPTWDPTASDEQFLGIYTSLIAFRRQHPWLVNAKVATLKLENTAYTYRVEDRGGQASIEVAIEGTHVRISEYGEVIWER